VSVLEFCFPDFLLLCQLFLYLGESLLLPTLYLLQLQLALPLLIKLKLVLNQTLPHVLVNRVQVSNYLLFYEWIQVPFCKGDCTASNDGAVLVSSREL